MRWLMVLGLVAGLAGCSVPASGAEYGTARVSEAGVSAELLMPNDKKIVLTSQGTKLRVGEYAPVSMTVMKKDAEGVVWSAVTEGKRFEVEAGETTVVEAPTKINARAYILGVGDGFFGRSVDLMPAYSGPKGELFAPKLMKGDEEVGAPEVTIMDGKGKVLETGQFEYG